MSGSNLPIRTTGAPLAPTIAPRPGLITPSDDYDLANLPDSVFTRGLAAMRTRQKRAEQIMREGLVEDVHFGNPKDKRGNPVFKKPILYVAGAEELRIAFKLRLVTLSDRPDHIIETAEYVSVTVYRGLVDMMGNIVAIRSASCNSLEKRFEKFNGSGMTYKDPRETVHVCLAMAEKRCGVALTREGLGLSGYFSAEEQARGDSDANADDVIQKWTDAEKIDVYAKASARGMGKKSLLQLVEQTLGRTTVGTGADVKLLLDAIEKWTKPVDTETHEALDDEDDTEGDA